LKAGETTRNSNASICVRSLARPPSNWRSQGTVKPMDNAWPVHSPLRHQTLAYDDAHDRIAPHIDVSVGLEEHSATGYTSHLLAATVQFLTEMLIIEISGPVMRLIPEASLYDMPQLRISDS